MGIVVEVSTAIHTGVEITATATHPFYIVTNAPSAHICDLCVDGEVDAFIKVELEGTYHITDFLDGVFLDEDVDLVKEPVFTFYVSLQNAPESVHKGKVTFGEGECPNLVWRTCFTALDEDGADSGAEITVARTDGTLVATGGSVMVEYLYDGSYTASAVIDGKPYTVEFTVKGAASDVVIQAQGPVSNNGGEVLEYQGNTYFWEYSGDSVQETGLFAYYSYNPNVSNQLVSMDQKGNLTVLYTGPGYGNLAIYDGRIYWNDYSNGEKSVFRMNLDGSRVEEFRSQAELVAIDDQQGVLICDTTANDQPSMDLVNLTASGGSTRVSGGQFLLLQDGVVYYEDSEDFFSKERRMGVTNLYAIHSDGSNTRRIATTPATLSDYVTTTYASIVHLQILDGYAYYTYGAYGGTAMLYQMGGLARASLDGSGVEILFGEDSVSNNVDEKFLAAKNSAGETVLYYVPYNGTVTDTPYCCYNLTTGVTTQVAQPVEFDGTIWTDENASVRIYQNGSDSATTLMSGGSYLGYTPLLKTTAYGSGSYAEFEQMDLVGDWLYYMVENSSYYPEGNLGWRYCYLRESSVLYRYNLTTGENAQVYGF